jgi:hypothetical protein
MPHVCGLYEESSGDPRSVGARGSKSAWARIASYAGSERWFFAVDSTRIGRWSETDMRSEEKATVSGIGGEGMTA